LKKIAEPLRCWTALAIAAAFFSSMPADAQALSGTIHIEQQSTVDNVEASAATASPGAVVSIAPEFPKRVLDALDFIDAGRYGDAADIANELCAVAPDSPIARQLRGTIELWIGDTERAQADFDAADRVDGDDAATHLALALCALRSTDSAIQQSTVLSELHRASTCPDITAEQTDDAATIGAYYQFIHGDATAVRELAEQSTTANSQIASTAGGSLPSTPPQSVSDAGGSIRAELLAVYETRIDPKSGAADLAHFLTTANGVPRVREDEGLRLIFTGHPALLEPTVTDPSMQAMYAARISQPRPQDPDASTANPVWGTITLAPTESNPATTSVIYTLDGAPLATVTSKPFSFDWNTRLLLNGVHTIKLEAHMDGGGIVGREERQVRVQNSADTIVGTDRGSMDPATYARIQSRIWNLLRPRPSRAVAEMTLAKLRAKAGDLADADTHNLIATALDPWLASIMHATIHRVRGAELTSRHISATTGVWSGYTGRKWVCLTFDDGPNAKTPALLDALDRAHVRATFFIVGSRAEEAPSVVRRMARSGHDVENHSYTHPNIAQCLPAMVESEILRTNIVIRSLTGRYPRFFRPPGGNASHTLAALADAYGLKLAFWSLDALKAEEESSKSNLVNYVLHHVHPGSIVLMHNGPDVTTAAIPNLVAGLRARGYEIVTLREIVNR
jgi:peptidoglycan/xylan/chitin deacetylase (PgdA/CDA1 family)